MLPFQLIQEAVKLKFVTKEELLTWPKYSDRLGIMGRSVNF